MIIALVHLVIYIVIIGVIVWLLLYLVQTIPLPAPFNQIARTVIIVVGVLICILLLLQFAESVPGFGKL